MDKLSSLKTPSSISKSPRRCRARVVLLAMLLLAGLVLCQAEEAEQDQEQRLNEQPNRQFFKVRLMSGGKKLLPKLKAARQQPDANKPADKSTVAAAASADGNEAIKATNSNKGQLEKQSKKGTATTISSATLKKLLNQTLLKTALSNATDPKDSGQKTSKNFKFVFIQRATAAPHLEGKVSSPLTSTTSSPPTSANEQQSSSSSSSSESLAASVSKQLASSLLQSAAGLVANLSSSPSLSSLASQIVAASAAANSIGDSPSTAPAAGAKDLSAAESSETKRREQVSSGSSSPNETGAAQKKPTTKTTTTTTTTKGTKSKPAKIYNLPVKFVANGQPNHVAVFHTLKEHFATIKRLQAMASSSSSSSIVSGSGNGTKTSSVVRLNKERKQQKQRHKPLKGTNSRLIYLPLRYLSNAKPNKIMISGSSSSSSKAAHKSS